MRSADQGPRPLPTSNMRSADQGPRPLPTSNMRSADQGPRPLPTSNMRSADQGPRPLPTSNMRSADQGPRPLPTSNMRSADQGPRPLPTSNMRSADQGPQAPACVQHEVNVQHVWSYLYTIQTTIQRTFSGISLLFAASTIVLLLSFLWINCNIRTISATASTRVLRTHGDMRR